MKILASGDIHGDKSLALKLADTAKIENVDLVVLCGDLTYFDQNSEGIVGPFKQNDLKVAMVPGNHDSLATFDFLVNLYDAINLNGYSIYDDNIGLFGCSAVNIGSNAMNEDEIFELLSKAHQNVKDKKIKVMVTHVHPFGSKIDKFSSFVPGSTAVRKAINIFKPDVLLCSHVHEAEGLQEKINNTLVVNVGKNGKIIELN